MRNVDELDFYTERQRDGRFVGRCREHPKLRTKPSVKSIDAVADIIELASQEIREIHERMDMR